MDDIERFLMEDLGSVGDITSKALFTDESGDAEIIVKESCVVAGITELEEVFHRTGAKTKILVRDGIKVKKNTCIAKISGSMISILSGERLTLNILGRMSGIATQTRQIVDLCKELNPKISIAATRKTTPGFRKYEKKAVEIGGGESHRFGLFDAVLIKDNHIHRIGSIQTAISRITENISNKTIEVEVKNEQDALLAAQTKVDWIMLDNFQALDAKKTALKIREINSSVFIEVSGGITLNNCLSYATFADRISLGFLTHTIQNIDFALNMY